VLPVTSARQQELHSELCVLLNGMMEGARTLTYLDLRKIWDNGTFLFKQLESNKFITDRFPTSWSVQRGHHFYLWTKVSGRAGNRIRSLNLPMQIA